ncbi:LPS export ABC transporter periplasmic protein LptC [Pleurocapsales cyanobacterium LEGE 10410]|nr:LPS export ABC transporter periplasmic protein LptC [Pleurocapsales cyanobacterium LEGE 10410]
MNIKKLKVNSAYLLPTVLIVSIFGCQAPPAVTDDVSQESRLDTQLVLNNAVLEQSNQQEDTVWKIKADSISYSQDKQTANLNKVVGNLWQNGVIILKVSAKTGKIQDNGNIILLNEEIIARDPRNGSVINSNAVEWRPQENLLLIKENLNGIHQDLEVTAAGGKYFTDLETLEIEGDVVATISDPALQLTSDRLLWDIAQNKLKSPGTVEIVRYEGERITDKLVADRAEVNLTENLAILNQNVELITLEPKLQAATDSFFWNYQQRVGSSDRPIQILDRDRQISLTGNQGEINLPQQIAKLQNGVRGINRQKGSELYARQLTWNIDTEQVEAMGNVIYEQSDPQARLTGEKAVGTLGDNNIVVTSNGKKQQVTSTIDN